MSGIMRTSIMGGSAIAALAAPLIAFKRPGQNLSEGPISLSSQNDDGFPHEGDLDALPENSNRLKLIESGKTPINYHERHKWRSKFQDHVFPIHQAVGTPQDPFDGRINDYISRLRDWCQVNGRVDNEDTYERYRQICSTDVKTLGAMAFSNGRPPAWSRADFRQLLDRHRGNDEFRKKWANIYVTEKYKNDSDFYRVMVYCENLSSATYEAPKYAEFESWCTFDRPTRPDQGAS